MNIANKDGFKYGEQAYIISHEFGTICIAYGNNEWEALDNAVDYGFMDNEMMSKEDIKSKDIEKFNLGPMLPSMEKHYWFFIDCDLIQKAQEGKIKIFIALYFEYPLTQGTSGYGMISEYNPKMNSFIHKDMWVEMGKNTVKK